MRIFIFRFMKNTYKNLVKLGILNGTVKKTDIGYDVFCNSCNSFRTIETRESTRRALKFKRNCDSCAQYIIKTGNVHSEKTKCKMSISHSNRYKKIEERHKTSNSIKLAMHRPDVREKHINTLLHSKWIKVRTDKGQIELLNKWNRLRFNFEPNYQIKTDNALYYIDGYDKIKNVILEFDSAYHARKKQKEKDLIRQNKIIKITSPTVFWRYNSEKNQFNIVYRKNK